MKRLAAEKRAVDAKSAEMAKQLAELQAWKAERAALKLNPGKFLEGELGDKWYDTLTQHRLQGAPTGDVIASELQAAQAQTQAKLDAQARDFEQRIAAFEAREAQLRKTEYESSVLAHVKASAEKYPAISHFSEEKSVLAEIESHFNATLRRHPDGTMEPGELLTPEAAAERVEKRIREIAEKAASLQAKLSPVSPKPPETPSPKLPRYGVPKRRSLSTEFTAPQGDWKPPKDDRERLQRAYAAADRDFEARQARH